MHVVWIVVHLKITSIVGSPTSEELPRKADAFHGQFTEERELRGYVILFCTQGKTPKAAGFVLGDMLERT